MSLASNARQRTRVSAGTAGPTFASISTPPRSRTPRRAGGARQQRHFACVLPLSMLPLSGRGMASNEASEHVRPRRAALRRLARRALAAAPLLAVCWTGVAAATTYYVRASGSDDNDGLTAATAFASVRPAARMLREPGDRLIVGPGTYREGNISSFGNGTPEAPIVLFGDSSGAATGDPPGPVTILPTNMPAATSGLLHSRSERRRHRRLRHRRSQRCRHRGSPPPAHRGGQHAHRHPQQSGTRQPHGHADHRRR